MLRLIGHLRQILPPAYKWALLGLCLLMALGAVMELAALGLVMTLVTAFTSPDLISSSRYLEIFYRVSGAETPQAFVILLAWVMILFYLFKNIYGWCLLWCQSLFITGLAVNISGRMYRNYLDAPYAWHTENGAAVLIDRVSRVHEFMHFVLRPVMLVSTEVFVCPAIILVLFAAAPKIAFAAAGTVVVMFLLFYLPMRKIVAGFGEINSAASGKMMLFLMQGLASIREVKLSGSQPYFRNQLKNVLDKKYFSAKHISDLSEIPRFAMEAFCICFAMGILIALIHSGVPMEKILFYAALFIASMFRLLPSFSRIQYNLCLIRGNKFYFDRIREDLTVIPKEKMASGSDEIYCRNELVLDHVTFTYPSAERPVISGFSCRIKARESVAFTGKTGCGKTTLANLIMGFLEPSSGTVTADGKDIFSHLSSWRSRIGYVPQNIVLFDDTVAANIAFGIPEEQVDQAQLKHVMELAQVTEFLSALPQGTETVIGEGGVRLSGGQKQRIAIARALYHNPEILILDEATSALDNDTEKALIDALGNLKGKLTILMIAHRISSTRYCDRTVSMES